MDETGTTAVSDAQRLRWRRRVITFCLGFSLWMCLWIVFAFNSHVAAMIQSIALPTLMMGLLGAFAYRQEQRWHFPANLLKQRLEEVRSGAATIDSLEEVQGNLSDIRQVVQEILREKREQDVLIAEMNAEMSVRVANRTGALERTISSLRTQATRDALTGLYNRRMFDEFLPKVFDKCRNAGEDLVALMIDVDNFKPLNDTLGHAAGDELLRNIGRLIRSTVRDQDVAFRLGGDEFCILLPKCHDIGARKLVDRLISLVDGLAKTMKVKYPPRLSIGVAFAKYASDTPESLLRQADENLYQVKRAAKSRAGQGSIRAAG